jgi:hypothetical protein
MMAETIPQLSGKTVAGSGTGFSLSGGLAKGVPGIAGYLPRSLGPSSVNSFRPFSSLADILLVTSTGTTIVQSKSVVTTQLPKTYPLEYPLVVWSFEKEAKPGLLAFVADVRTEAERTSFRTAKEQLTREWFEEKQSHLEIAWRDFSELLGRRIERRWQDIGRSTVPEDVVFDDDSLSESVVEEESLEIRPRMSFGFWPIPDKPKRIRLTDKIRAALPPEALPKSLSLPIGEEIEP